MNKLKAWLIRKLGGCVLSDNAPKIVYETLPDIKITVDIRMSEPRMFHNTEALSMDLIEREAARRLGEFIMKNHLYKAQQYYSDEFSQDIMRYTVRLIKEET
jgi:hypothetical protein